MDRTFDMSEFDKAIREKNYIKIKNYIVNSIRNNPGFLFTRNVQTCSEATEAFLKVRKMRTELPGLFTQYRVQPGEKVFNEKDKASWDKEYFIRQTFLLEENFCDKRFKQVYHIGRYLAGNDLKLKKKHTVI